MHGVALNPAARAAGFSTATVRERSGLNEQLVVRPGRRAVYGDGRWLPGHARGSHDGLGLVPRP